MFDNEIGKFGSLIRKFLKWIRPLQCERGFTESSLVLIPTIILFLCLIQIGASILSRTSELNLVQGETSRSSLFGQAKKFSGYSNIPDGQNLASSRKPLPGGGYLIVRKSTRKTPGITPLLPMGDSFETIGISVDENN